MIERVLQQLNEGGYTADVLEHASNIIYVKVSGYVLPPATCVEATADIALPLPTTFARAAPYGFFALTTITKRSGDWTNVSYGTAPLPAARFFSRKCPTWDEVKSDVFTYLGFVNSWLEPRV